MQLLIDSVVRRTTVLIAQLATAGGARAPLAHVANQVFLDPSHVRASEATDAAAAIDGMHDCLDSFDFRSSATMPEFVPDGD